MQNLLLSICIQLFFMWFLFLPMAEGLCLALFAGLAQFLLALGLSAVGIVVLAWFICLVVVLARRVQ